MAQFTRRLVLLGVVLAGLTVVSAAVMTSGLASNVQAAAAPPDGAVTIEGFQFAPKTLEVRPGTKVVWTNNDTVTHTVTSGTPDRKTDTFDRILQGKGVKFEFTFAQAGTFAYFCARHNSMRGEVVVKP
jgi:plastocyanin